MDVITLNVGGTVFTTQKSTLQSVPATRLSNLNTTVKEYDANTKRYFFDRNSRVFDGILDFYRTGELHFPRDICGAVLRRELEFWKIPLFSVSDCCFSIICDHDDSKRNMRKLKAAFNDGDSQFSVEQLRNSQVNRVRNIIWRTMNFPKSSVAALIFAILYPVWLILPILTSVLATHPSCREAIPYSMQFPYGNVTVSLSLKEYLLLYTGNPKAAFMFSTTTKPELIYIDRICLLCFGTELVLRLVCCPRISKLFKSPLFYVDCVVLITSFIAFGIEVDKSFEKLFWLYIVCKWCLIIRLFRLMHLARHIGGLRVLVLAFQASLKELLLLLLSFVSVAVFFAAIVYYAEFHKPDTFEHMPITIWWSIVTMTTVGYGDFTPSTLTGYTVGCVCAITGVLIVSMPIAVIAANFTELYNINKIRLEKANLSDTSSSVGNQCSSVKKTCKIACVSSINVKSKGDNAY